VTASGGPNPATSGTGRPRDEDLDFFGVTHPGLVRRDNQDHFLYSTLHKTMRVKGTSLPNPELLEMPSQRIASFGMVADGVGGREGGEVASRSAVEAIAMYLTNTLQTFYTVDYVDETAFLAALRDGASAAHQTVMARANETGDGEGIATTLTALMAIWPALYILQVGDSRCYRFRDGVLEQLTRDQTMAQELVDLGVLPPERAGHSRFAHVLSSSIGGHASRPVVTMTDLRSSDVLMLCTDGLTKHVTHEQMTERLRTLSSSEQVARQLVDDALADGGSDNVTVVIHRALNRQPGESR